ncbi:tetraacyldisaccharide 4'-kinase [Parelusimicrobium proximum]|uniref:tetraacyldisaccharide 4'-kinase n=1 Tax=Parelusimicrobium proximum TaxID=3228953 RepID=UPI003D16CFBB
MDLLKVKEKFESNFIGRGILAVASWIYGALAAFNKFMYDHGWKKSNSVNTRVVCIGNITSGGTGKTTAVMLAARTLAEEGVRVAIVSRGYKRDKKNPDPVVLFDDELENTWQTAGDEPFMMSRALADVLVPVVVHENRYLAAQEALKRFKSQVILLDDGFQHYKLKRDANIVLIDAVNPFGGGKLLPAGMLREPMDALKRANLVVITHSDLADERKIENIKDEIRLYNDNIEIITSVHKPEYFLDICESKKIPLNALSGKAAVFSALGEPAGFEGTLEKLGLKLEKIWRYPDHQVYTIDDLMTFVDIAGDMPIVTTFKDFVKFPENWREVFKKNVYVLSINMQIKDDRELNIFTETLYPNFAKLKEKNK